MSYLKNGKNKRKFDVNFDEKEFKSLGDILGETLIISGVVKIKTRNGIKSVWEFVNYSDNLFWGNSILDGLADEILEDDEIVNAVKEGKVKIKLYSKVSKNGREYIGYTEVE